MTTIASKSIVLTGASEGIGRALASRLAAPGMRLTLAARNADRLTELAKQCEAQGAECLIVAGDITDLAESKQLIAEAVSRFGTIDVLINNAGGTMWSLFEELEDLQVLERVMRLNYLAAAHCTYHALPHLRKSRGLIVAVASVAGVAGVPTRTGYAASKHAMIGFFDSLRIELAGSGVDVTIVAPDFVLSEIHRRAIGADGAPLGTSPLQESRIMTADACAQIIVQAMAGRQRLRFTSWRGRMAPWLKLIAPQLVDRLAAQAIRRGK